MAQVAQTFEQTDSGYQQLNKALDDQVTNMKNADTAIESLVTTINQNFQAQACTTWVQKIQDWRDNYARVTSEVQLLTDNVQLAANAINNAHDDAIHMAGGINTSPAGGLVYSTLTNS
jgi:phosphoenolpyruvate-protein kinase (PTS system EI component)